MTMMGEFLKRAPKNTGSKGHGPGRGKKGSSLRVPPFGHPTLAESGISKKESAAAQDLATLKQEDPELHEEVRNGAVTIVAGVKVLQSQGNARPTLSQVIEAAPQMPGQGKRTDLKPLPSEQLLP